MVLKSLVGFWMLARMVFHAMPCNDPTSPGSLMSPMHAVNVRLRLVLAESYGIEGPIRVDWTDVWPALVAVECSVMSTIVLLLFGG